MGQEPYGDGHNVVQDRPRDGLGSFLDGSESEEDTRVFSSELKKVPGLPEVLEIYTDT